MQPWMLVESGTDVPFGTRIESVGAKLPEHRVSTRDLMASTRHHTRIDLERLTGIRERRVCDADETSLSLALDAARDCLSHSSYTGADLDVVIDASITRYVDGTTHRFEPPLSHTIKEAIGAHAAMSFDISNACAGMLTGVFVLNEMIRRGTIRRGMVVSGERITGLGANAARTIRSIFSLQLASLTLGDAGAAVIVDRSAEDTSEVQIAGFSTLAEHSRLCIGIPALHHPGAVMFTRARKIHEVAMEGGPPLLDEILEAAGVTLSDIDWLIPHQTSVRAIQGAEKALAARTGEHPKHMVITVDDYGNTASTTLFVALHRYLSEGKIKSGDKVLLLSVASGLQIGVVLFDVGHLEVNHGDVH
jgi:3-oxoacyl-[acyl-carrier-protein] synthase-3